MKIEYFSFENLHILDNEIEELMGFGPGQSPEPFPELISEGMALAAPVCYGTGGYKIFSSVHVDLRHQTISIGNEVFHPGKTVTGMLKNATHAALFLCTAGPDISALAREKSTDGNEMMAYVLDVIGSIATNKTAEMLLGKIKDEAAVSGMGITDSFSPGYCNWNVSEQKILFSLLPDCFCGISLSENSMMTPVKSVSGITGIGSGLYQKGHQCDWCTDTNCFYGKIRRGKNVKINL
jgi:hypothetical protein